MPVPWILWEWKVFRGKSHPSMVEGVETKIFCGTFERKSRSIKKSQRFVVFVFYGLAK